MPHRFCRAALAAIALLAVTAAPALAHVHGDGVRVDKLERSGLAGSTTPFFRNGAPFSAADYDGKALAADAPDLTSLPTIHAVYLYPSDAANRFADLAPMIQRDMRLSADNFQTATGMTLRWDERASGDRRLVDITVLKSRVTTRRMRDGAMWSQVQDDVRRAGLTNANKKYLVWVDAPQSAYCGMSTAPLDTARKAANAANGRTISTINRYYEPTTATFGFCSPVVHELLHSMGAVNPIAPNDDGTDHAIDSGNDMLGTYAARIPYDPASGFYIDYGNDDYLDPAADAGISSTAKLPWWTVNLSRFLCPRAALAGAPADCSRPNNPTY